SASTNTTAGFAELQSTFFGRLYNSATVRVDENSRFGGAVTYREAPALLFPETGTKLKGSVGTGFKAPTLNELFVSLPAFNFFANPNLKPETSIGYDLGFEQSLWEDRVKFGSTWFHNDIDNLIAANATFTTNINVARATTYGVENFVAVKPIDPLTLRVNYT